jgi:hypothetical protein
MTSQTMLDDLGLAILKYIKENQDNPPQSPVQNGAVDVLGMSRPTNGCSIGAISAAIGQTDWNVVRNKCFELYDAGYIMFSDKQTAILSGFSGSGILRQLHESGVLIEDVCRWPVYLTEKGLQQLNV